MAKHKKKPRPTKGPNINELHVLDVPFQQPIEKKTYQS
jgi:hypothetical protein